MKYVIDSYAWIEYFMGTQTAEKIKTIIEGMDEKITPTTCLAEIYAKTLRVESNELSEKQKTFIKQKSALAPLDEPSAVESAKINNKLKKEIDGWSLADSIVYATAQLKSRSGYRRPALQKTKKYNLHLITILEEHAHKVI